MQLHIISKSRYNSRTLLCVVILLLVGVLSGCTAEIRILTNCGNDFAYRQTVRSVVEENSFKLSRPSNVDPLTISTYTTRSQDGKQSSITIYGKRTDPCAPVTVDYVYRDQSGTMQMVETIPALTMTASAPPSHMANPWGVFEYPIQFNCCPGAESDYIVTAEASDLIFLAAAAIPREMSCPNPEGLKVVGQLLNPAVGGKITVTITGPDGSCTFETWVNPGG